MEEKNISDLDNMTFEEALKKLEGDVLSLERGDLGLEEAIKVYEEGIKYSNYLMQKLESAEKRVEELTVKNNGMGEKSPEGRGPYLDRLSDGSTEPVSSLLTKPLEID